MAGIVAHNQTYKCIYNLMYEHPTKWDKERLKVALRQFVQVWSSNTFWNIKSFLLFCFVLFVFEIVDKRL